MFLLNWMFPRGRMARPPAPTPAPAAAAARTQASLGGSAGVAAEPDLSRLDPAALRKFQRAERREALYGVVRDSLRHAGILSSRYRFKVLMLDQRGLRFLVMVDLARELAGETRQLVSVEQHIMQAARASEIEVAAVYWRTNERIDPGRGRAPAPQPTATAAVAAARVQAASAADRTLPLPSAARFEPIQADEIEAFQRALAIDRDQQAGAQADFEDTQSLETGSRPGTLGQTQYGDPR